MCYRNFNTLSLLMVYFFLSGCGTTPVVTTEDAARTATAKRFVQNGGGGKMAMAAFMKELERESNNQPGMKELLKREFADINQEYFENQLAEVYSRHLAHEDLMELAALTEKPAMQKIFDIIFDGMLLDRPRNHQEMFGQFSTGELMDIMNLSFNDSFVRMTDALPEIHKDITQSSKRLGEEILRNFITTR